MLLEVPRTTYNDLDAALTEKDLEMIYQFEEGWYEFLSYNPDILPPSRKGRHCKQLERQIEKLQESKRNVEAELKRQLNFFSSSKDQLETNFRKTMAEAAMDQQKMHQRINEQIDNVAVADHNNTMTIPWEHFFDSLDQAVIRSDTQTLPVPLGDKAMKPSARAMFLVNAANDKTGHQERYRDLMRRAYETDNALLSAQVKMATREVDSQQKATESLEVLGKFFTEHNIWGLLNKSSAATSAGSTL